MRTLKTKLVKVTFAFALAFAHLPPERGTGVRAHLASHPGDLVRAQGSVRGRLMTRGNNPITMGSNSAHSG